MQEADLPAVVRIEHASYAFPWTEGIFRDCLRVNYVCRVVESRRQSIGYGIMSVGAREAHVLNLCVAEEHRCRGIGRRLLTHLLQVAARRVRARRCSRRVPRTSRRCVCTTPSASRRSARAAATTRRWVAAKMPSCSSGTSSRIARHLVIEADIAEEIERRRTFAIISHPDAGKTTLTEKLLLFGGAITMAGAVKGRKAARHATSDWMRLEQQRGISVTSSVMQFPYGRPW